MDLAKHTAGAPLTPAELQQRRDAARARWAAAGAVAGAAASTLAVQHASKLISDRAWRQVRAAHEASVRPAMREQARVERRSRMRAAVARQEIASEWPVPHMRAALRRDLKAADAALKDVPHQVVGEDLLGKPILDYGDLENARRAWDIDATKTRATERLKQLEGAYPPGADTTREGGDVKAARAHVRRVVTRSNELRPMPMTPAERRAWDALPREERRARIAQSGRPLSPQNARDKKLIDAAAKEAGVAPAYPKAWYRNTTRTIEVNPDQGKKIVRRAATLDARGNPGPHAIAAIRRDLSDRLDRYFSARAAARSAARTSETRAAKAAFRGGTAIAARALQGARFMGRSKIGLGLALGLGALGGAVAGDRLTKADDGSGAAPDAADPAESYQSGARLLAHGTAAETTMADRLARMFRSWKDETTANLLDGRRTQSLRESVAADLAHATAPIDVAVRAGATTPVPVSAPIGGGPPKTLAFTLGNARSPTVEAYVASYRKNMIAELTGEQMEAIADILIDAAKTGASPDAMALRIRQTIGLTANQAQQVLNYRAELQGLREGALDRKLRDKRYDRTIRKAIDGGKPLSDEQINAMVDAYHRRYLAYRAMTIARTEGVGAANNGHMAAVQDMLDANPDMTVVKTWMAHLDEKTRPDHVGLDGQSVVGLNTPFTAESGDTILWPHHQDAPARQVCNCRCSLATRLVPKSIADQFATDISKKPETVNGV